MTQDKAAGPVPAPDQVKLAMERTFLAHERTMMAWIRTAVSLITFGFTMYKFFDLVAGRGPEPAPQHVLGVRTIGMVMIAIGVFTLVLATWQHRVTMGRLKAHYPEAPFSMALLLAALISGLGILAMISTIHRG